MSATNPDPRVEGILPGLIYLTDDDPRDKIFTWGETDETDGARITVFHGDDTPRALPATTTRSLLTVTIIGFGPERLHERIHKICWLYAEAGIRVVGRYRVEGSVCHSVPDVPCEPTTSEPISYVPEYDGIRLDLATHLVQAEFRFAAAQHSLDLERRHPGDDPGFNAAVEAAGSRVLNLLNEGRPVQELTVEERAHLLCWITLGSGYAAALDLTRTVQPGQYFVDQWTALLSLVPGSFVPVPASLLAVGAWRIKRPLLARCAVDLAAKTASSALPPLHEAVDDLIKEDIFHATSPEGR